MNIDSINFAGKKAIIRVDFNVPLTHNLKVIDDTRIKAAVPTIKKVLTDGGSVILMSHLGRPKNGPENSFSIKHIVKSIEENLGQKIEFINDTIGEKVRAKAQSLKPRQVLMLENLRFYKEEKAGDKNFAKQLSQLADYYINDAFGTAHRAHASTAIIANYFSGKCFGYLMNKEINTANKVMQNPARPLTAVIGGAKVSDKILIIENLIHFANNIIIGGGMAYTFYKAMGGTIGNSLCENERLKTCLEILDKAKKKGVNIILPKDSIVADKFKNNANTKSCPSNNIPDGWMGLDIGEKAIENFSTILQNSKTIVWNGPMGVFEMKKFENGTKSVANAVVEATNNGAFSLIGGGDSAAAIKQFGLQNKVSYMSTGGGALLEMFEGKTLPGIEYMNKQNAN